MSEPSSSAKQVVGSSNTSVWIVVGSTSLNSPWFSQNRAVSVCSGSMTTRNLSLRSAVLIFARLGNDLQRVEALADVAVHLALVHQLEGAQDVVGCTSSLGSQS